MPELAGSASGAGTGNSSEHGSRDELGRLNLVGDSPAWRAAYRMVQRIAANDATALLEGETGTGKELVARAVHYLGARRDFPFIPLNCGALPDSLLESELFGYERGAFTDARERRGGLVAEARGGTLFLDEIEVMSRRAQIVLLRFLQDHTYLPVGGRTLISADVRIIAATNDDLGKLAERGQFRRDLLFRLRVLHLRLPPLRERTGDVALLAQKFLERYCRLYRRPQLRLCPESIYRLESYAWPGNVRELENLVLRELLLHEGTGDQLTIGSASPDDGSDHGATRTFSGDFKRAKAQAIAQFETSFIRDLLRRARGNVSLAARFARKDRSALNRLIKKHGIQIEEFRDGDPEAVADAELG
jgi:two-component system response regulator GlrR